MKILAYKNWSPYISGAIIGLLQAPLVFFLDKTLGVSSASSLIAYHIHTFFLKDIFSDGTLHSNFWQIGLAFGTFIGAYLSAKFSKIHRHSISPVWNNEFGITSKKQRYCLSFFGGMLLIFGARLANGCTSGNGISGTSQLDVSSWIVLGAMFLSGIATTLLLKLPSVRKGE